MPDEPQAHQPQEQSSMPDQVSSSVSSPNSETPLEVVPEVEVEPATSESAVASTPESEENSTSAASELINDPQANDTLVNLEPGADTSPSSTSPSLSSKKNGKKKWLVGGITAAVLVVLIGGGALAYNLWYQNPQKVILDGVVHLLTGKENRQESITSTFESSDAKLTVDGTMRGNNSLANGSAKVTASFKGTSASLGNISLSVDTATTKSATYFKLSGLKTAVDGFVDSSVNSMASAYKQSGFAISQQEIDQEKQTMESEFAPIVNKVEGQWIKVDTTQSDSSNASQCTLAAVNQLYTNSSEQSELEKVYNNNQFITIKKNLGSKDGSLGYDLGLDKAKAKQFASALKNTAFGAQLKKCDSSAFSSSDTSVDTSNSDIKNGDFQIWITRWTHQITEVKFSGDSMPDSSGTTFNGDLQIKYGNVSGLSTPNNATDIKDIEKQINSLFGGALSTGSSTTTSSI